MKKYLWLWTVWIALASAIYSSLYTLTPLSEYGIVWMSFVALPIYFNAGAKAAEFPHYFCSMICGIIWGVINLAVINLLESLGLPYVGALFIDLATVTVACVGLHMIVLERTWLNKVPMIFGGLAMTFSQGGENLVPVGLTLMGGLILGVAISVVGGILEKWILGRTDPPEAAELTD